MEISRQGGGLNADVPLRRYWNPGKDWIDSISREEYLNAFFYHGSAGALAAVRSGDWKLHLNPSLTLYNLKDDPGEKKPVRNGEMTWKMRGMAVMFQDEMRLFTRPAGEARPLTLEDKSIVLEEHPDLTYAERASGPLQLDLYRPADMPGPLPAIVCIHGGGWSKGSRQGYARIARALAKKGFVTATISYRLSGVAPFPAQIEDCQEAVDWLRKNAGTYGIDPDRIATIGHSAGGHLSALMATTDKARLKAAIATGAQTDLLSERNRQVSSSDDKGMIWRQFLGGTQDEKRELYREASPLAHLDAGDPPIFFITGEQDDPSTRADVFRETAAEMGLQTDLLIIDDKGHNFFNTADSFDQTINAAAEFLWMHLK